MSAFSDDVTNLISLRYFTLRIKKICPAVFKLLHPYQLFSYHKIDKLTRKWIDLKRSVNPHFNPIVGGYSWELKDLCCENRYVVCRGLNVGKAYERPYIMYYLEVKDNTIPVLTFGFFDYSRNELNTLEVNLRMFKRQIKESIYDDENILFIGDVHKIPDPIKENSISRKNFKEFMNKFLDCVSNHYSTRPKKRVTLKPINYKLYF